MQFDANLEINNNFQFVWRTSRREFSVPMYHNDRKESQKERSLFNDVGELIKKKIFRNHVTSVNLCAEPIVQSSCEPKAGLRNLCVRHQLIRLLEVARVALSFIETGLWPRKLRSSSSYNGHFSFFIEWIWYHFGLRSVSSKISTKIIEQSSQTT